MTTESELAALQETDCPGDDVSGQGGHKPTKKIKIFPPPKTASLKPNISHSLKKIISPSTASLKSLGSSNHSYQHIVAIGKFNADEDDNDDDDGYYDGDKTPSLEKAEAADKTASAVDAVDSERHGNGCGRCRLDSYFLLSTYCVFGVGILSLMVAALIRSDDAFTDKVMILILCCMLLTTALSAAALFKYGRMQDQIARLKDENRIYNVEITGLRKTTTNLSKDITELENLDGTLRQQNDGLDAQSKEFEYLTKQLEGIAEHGESALDVVEELNLNFEGMSDLIYQNEKARLLAVYYECAFRDADDHMSRTEYDRFLNKISKQFRLKFIELGYFEDISQGKGYLDLVRFLQLIDTVLKQSQDVMKRALIQQYTIEEKRFVKHTKRKFVLC